MNYIFLISPNNSGTTIASQFISSKIENCYLPKTRNNEGLKIKKIWETIKETRWDPDVPINYNLAKCTWEKLSIQNQCSSFFEASPPNMCHLKEIIQEFKKLIVIFWISNPYLYIGSCVNRYHKDNFSKSVSKVARNWIEKAKIQRQNHLLSPSAPKINYEEFCKAPDNCLEKKLGHIIDLKQEPGQISGKNTSKITTVADMTAKQIAFLGTSGLHKVAEELCQHAELLKYFGYKILSPVEINTILQLNVLLAVEGGIERLAWEKKSKNHGKRETNEKT